MIKRRVLHSKDFKKVSDFLKKTYHINSSNWTIERWSWSRFFNGYWLETFETWPSTVGMWVNENDEIMALCLNEGPKSGDAFFQLRDMIYEEAFFHEILDFSEEHHAAKSGNKAYLYPRVNNIHKDLFVKVLTERGYSYSGKDEPDSSIQITDKLTGEIPEGYKIELANKYEASVRALAHGRAFSGDPEAVKALMHQRTRAYMGLVKSPDYNENLDLCLVDHNNDIAAFATFWFDEKNLIGSLEPLGTVAGYQKRGLGKVLVYEGMNRLRELGATKLHVGSNQPFYKKIGFDVESLTQIWQKEF